MIMKLNIVDAGCGIGKTTALINEINNDISNQVYIYVTPFLSEVERIKKACYKKKFISPDTNSTTKLESFSKLISQKKNIVTTHALFKRIDVTKISIEELKDYTLIIDESIDVIEELEISKSDLKMLQSKVSINPRTHMVEWDDNEYKGKFNEYMNMIKLNNVFAYIDKDDKIVSLMWLFPFKIFQAFKSIFLLTYMFDGQIQKKYFDYFETKYIFWYIKDYRLTQDIQIYDYKNTKSLINVCENKKLNEIGENKTALSVSWFSRNKNGQKITKLQNNMRSFFRSCDNITSEDILWTTFKEYKKYIKKNGFVKGFAPINSRATNEYSKKIAIAYIGNRFFKPTIKNFFIFNKISTDKDFEDKFALSELVQFIYRGAIRNNKKIYVYIPSKRMRNLFVEWLKKPNI